MGYDEDDHGIIAKHQQLFFNEYICRDLIGVIFDSDIKDAFKSLVFILSWISIVKNNLLEIWLDYK
jgi:hypothetical protein